MPIDPSEYYARKNAAIKATRERARIEEYSAYLKDPASPTGRNWRKWGCYLSERQWGTVRESRDLNNSWNDFPRDNALRQAYGWGEDGIAGISDDHQFLCFAVAMWNGNDPCIKERLYGLTNEEGNHGEDVKESYFYLDNTPTHSYMKYLYKYPFRYPYENLYDNRASKGEFEYELVDTGALSDGYFDVLIEYAKVAPGDIRIRITATNRGSHANAIHLLPTLWFRDTKRESNGTVTTRIQPVTGNQTTILATATRNGAVCSSMWLHAQEAVVSDRTGQSTKAMLGGARFTDNETGKKDAIDKSVRGVSPDAAVTSEGTKAAFDYAFVLAPGASAVAELRLCDVVQASPFSAAKEDFEQRIAEADEFYDAVCAYGREDSNAGARDLHLIQRQAFAGMLWNKQFYHLVAKDWLDGARQAGDLPSWRHLYCKDILSMPDKWEYPWFAAWDLAFHATTFALIDPEFAKHQLLLLVMEWYMHPNGQIPAYEWSFSNINPPVHAWAAWNVYQRESELYGNKDREFLERVFNRLNMNFTWWVNKVDEQGNNLFEGGFLGMDNIRSLDKGRDGRSIEQSDGTAWMAMFCLNMVKIAHELSQLEPGYTDQVRMYLQHFILICDAMNKDGSDSLWDNEKGFFFDYVPGPGGGRIPAFSNVGLVPLFAVESLGENLGSSESFASVRGMAEWFRTKRPELFSQSDPGKVAPLLLDDTQTSIKGVVSVVDKTKLQRILSRVLDPHQFLSRHGVRSLSQEHLPNRNPARRPDGGDAICYEPAESNFVKLMGGNSNWRGPIWFPTNYMLVQSLHKFDQLFGGQAVIDDPSRPGHLRTLQDFAIDLSQRLIGIFRIDTATNRRPVHGDVPIFQAPDWRDCVLFYEYFHGGDENDSWSGIGLGASHQTGWTGLVANLIDEIGSRGIGPDWSGPK